ncbi:MAG TPA: Ppx/GppA phosphatase family protein [Bryobacteraceae bacterium]|nr:Ppx/GppA phosphatase family protein [Bryobacteraceae bacterium]
MPRYAAIDIGSNSVRMQAAEVVPGGPTQILAADREVTRLGESVFKNGRISPEATALVNGVLSRMAVTYRELGVVAVRAVATSAVRDASNQSEFIADASQALGTPVEIISGPEEARLIHLGVQTRWPHPKQSILVIDVGGGSAEFIVGDSGEMREGISRPLGAVRLTEVFLKSDPPSAAELHRMENFIDEKFQPTFKRLQQFQVNRVIGTSATAAAIVSAANRVPRNDRDAADRMRAAASHVKQLYRELSQKSLADRRRTPGIGPRRADIIIAGTAVFSRVLERLELPSMYYSVAGVRDGIIADLAARGVGRELSRLTRQQLRVVETMCRKFNADIRNAKQVARLTLELFDELRSLHGLPADAGRLLEAAAYLHDAGHYISDTGHHKHSAYIVMNSDMPGYTDQERKVIALLCRYHRKSMPAGRHEVFRSLPQETKQMITLMAPLLRLGVALDSSREQKVQEVTCHQSSGGATITVKGTGDLDLEIWAAERAADLFRQASGANLAIQKQRR